MRRCIKKKINKGKGENVKVSQLCRADQTKWLQSASVLEANTFPIKTFITALWLEGLFSFFPFFIFFFTSLKCLKKKPPQLSLSSALHFIAYWYSLWSSRWKVPHLHPLFMVINRLSVDPECLNLTQKCLTSLICFYSCLCQRYVNANTWAAKEINKGWQHLWDV